MKKVCLVFNHLQHQDGVARSAIAIANWFTVMKVADVTLIPIYTNDKNTYVLLEPGVKIRPVIGHYFRGLPHVVDRLPISWITKLVIKEDYDIIIGFQYGLSIRCVAAIKDDYHHAKKIAWMHTYDDGLLFRKEYESIGEVVCVSRCNSSRLHKELPSIQVDYSYNPIDEKFVQQCGDEPVDIWRPTNIPLFVSVGRMSPEKGYGRLLDICKQLKDEGFKFMLWLIGDGPIYGELQKKRKELGLDDYVLFLGQKSNPHKYTAKSDVFICSSFSEGYSSACTEAVMLGVPIITTCVSGAEEIIEDAECGKMVGMDDESLYDGLREVIQDPSIIKNWKQQLSITRERFYAHNRILRLINILGLQNEIYEE